MGKQHMELQAPPGLADVTSNRHSKPTGPDFSNPTIDADAESPVRLSAATAAALSAALLAACGGGGGGGIGGALTGTADPGSAAAGVDGSTVSGTASTAGTAGTAGSTASAGTADGANPGPAPVVNVPVAPGFNNNPKANTDEEAARFLLQSQLSASDLEISNLKAGNFAGYLQQQFAKPIGQTGLQWLEERGYGTADTNRYFFQTYPAEFMLWKQLFTAEDSMRKRMALALSEFFVASMQSAEFDWRSHGYGRYWDLLNNNAFGNYRQLLEDVTLSPAMGGFLNTRGNQKEDTKTGRVPDENYAREVMQLFSIGLVQLNLDGTEKMVDGKKVDSYTQADVTNLARVFTGYNLDSSDGEKITVLRDNGSPDGFSVFSRQTAIKPMTLDASKHSSLAANFLGASVGAGVPGADALKIALDTLTNHPNTGPFFARQMIQRLVTSNPSPAYVERVARAFNNNGAGVRGDLKAVWVAILLDDEARSAQSLTSPTFGKLREPMLRFIQWGRTFGLKSGFDSWKVSATRGTDDSLGQSPLFAPSVFNFFRPGFVPPNTALAASKAPAPEFQGVNETTVGGYLNYMQNVIRYGIYVPEPSVAAGTFSGKYLPDVAATYIPELALVFDAPALVRRLNLLMCAGQLSAATQKTMADALNANALAANSNNDRKLDRVCAGVLMVLGCSEYLVQK
jgi:uncharacterized protein (DUF1800 family)